MNRKFQIAYQDGDAKFFSRAKAQLERFLRNCIDFEINQAHGPDDPIVKSCDVFLIAADHIREESFMAWFKKLEKHFQKNRLIWIPAIIFAEVPLDLQQDLFRRFNDSNWYFDIVHPKHLDSIALRVANLLRIHDHLRELHRYNLKLIELESQVLELSNDLSKWQKKEI